MKKTLQAEELVMFAACLYYFPGFGLSWWWFAALILLPDLSMVGYLLNPRAGAFLYNLFHHRGVALIVFFAGFLSGITWLQITGLVLFAHATMDRMLGYGLKFEKGFRYTHLGVIGRDNLEGATKA